MTRLIILAAYDRSSRPFRSTAGSANGVAYAPIVVLALRARVCLQGGILIIQFVTRVTSSETKDSLVHSAEKLTGNKIDLFRKFLATYITIRKFWNEIQIYKQFYNLLSLINSYITGI